MSARPQATDELEALAAEIAQLGAAVVAREPLARHTTFHIGGPADLFATAATVEQLAELAELAFRRHMPATVLGGGSNVLVSDAGIRGLVIANATRVFGFDPPDGAGLLVADAGVALAGLARWAIRNGWSGLEWAVSVPGSIGGAVIGNAGAHGSNIAANLEWVELAYPGAGRRVVQSTELGFTYRSSVLKRRAAAGETGPVVLRAAFRLAPGDVAELAARAEAYLARRRETQPTEPSAGSIFCNPPGDFAGRLIEAAGLKGCRIGGAQVSDRHANFIVNVGGATAADVAALMQLVRQRVFEETGIALAPETLFLGAWDEPPLSDL